MKKTIIRTIAIALICSLVIPVSAFAATTNEVITATMYRNLTVTYNSEKQTFFDANGKQVFPIASEGTVYIPVRAMSNLLQTSIEWIGSENKINIGNSTFVEPTYTDKNLDSNTNNENISVTVMKDLTVMYNGKEQSFFDVNGKQVYPVAANGTTYLPIRATSKMFDTAIEWIGAENRIAIGTDKPVTPEVPSGSYDLSVAQEFYGSEVQGVSPGVALYDSYKNSNDIFTGKVLVFTTSDYFVDSANTKINLVNGGGFYINYTLHNYGNQEVTVSFYSEGKYSDVTYIKAGETINVSYEDGGLTDYFTLGARTGGKDPNICVAMGNLELK